ncbi:oxidoreductase [Echinicola strongylocentroti]|uniref:Oxidoreductase n=1 Tax=Echinicola strongylocentroti TaxID=1795355 RepID=A0A2Z4IEU9_9BACT|nr:YhdH/YhfP family quinone oxidoreductase [Echinicola strongylocentroti]AWW29612.1 oxidoreductase [Echinicola strongylocentroti]
MKESFNAFLVSEKEEGIHQEIAQLPFSALPSKGVLIKVSYSSVNFKDALSATGNKGVTKKFPHVPGIDAVGEVVDPDDSPYHKGDKVLVTGYDLGMNTWGGYGEYIKVPESWILPLPKDLSEKESMCYGTAGLTAGLSVSKILKAGIVPSNGPVIVSGASGGVGSISTAILSKLGYEVHVITSKNSPDYFQDTLGASEITSREEFIASHNKKPMSRPTYAAGIDCTGGEILSGIVKSVKYNGVVTCCGMVASPEIHTSIFPFILRGISLIGIDSVEIPLTSKKEIWQKLAKEWKPSQLTKLAKEISLDQLSDEISTILKGKAKGRAILTH